MIRLDPVIHPTIWGGDRLKKYLTEDSLMPERIGHLYLVNGHEGMSNIISEGKFKGYTLKELFNENKDIWGLGEYDEFPLTIALVDARDSLSIQIHPDRKAAYELENIELGKEESWYFIDRPNNGFIYYGTVSSNADDINKAILEDNIEGVIGHVSINKGDYICVKEGTPHAMSAGSLVYEVEYGSDITYRFYDYHRKNEFGKERELHVEKAIRSIKHERSKEQEVIRPILGTWICEDNYEILIMNNPSGYKNKGTEIECVADLERGRAVLLFPGESLNGVLGFCAVARLIRR